jgi:hypothetical protein
MSKYEISDIIGGDEFWKACSDYINKNGNGKTGKVNLIF